MFGKVLETVSESVAGQVLSALNCVFKELRGPRATRECPNECRTLTCERTVVEQREPNLRIRRKFLGEEVDVPKSKLLWNAPPEYR